jgi:hypothetical protein
MPGATCISRDMARGRCRDVPRGRILREIASGKQTVEPVLRGLDGRTVYVTEVDGRRLVFRVERPGLEWVRWRK